METSKINVLLLIADAKPQRDWTDHASLRVWPGGERIPSTLQPDVVISDCPQLLRAALTNSRLRDSTQFGLILVGCESAGRSADVHLPADATGRELRLACQLLGNLVQERRLQRSRVGEFQILAQWALQDPLTGLANRRAWDQQLQELANSGAALTKPLCLAMLDVDKLKHVNDARGHDAGDAVLRAAASGLRGALRASDFAARWGGDEFALLLQDVPPQHARAIVERIRAATDRQIAEQTEQTPTLSAGVVGVASGTVIQTDRLWQRADAALLKAKHAGGSCSVEYTPPGLQAE